MNTKKAFWLKRPKKYIETTLHSFSWNEEGSSSVYWTIGEEGTLSLSFEKDDEVQISFVLLHTPSDFIRFSQDGIHYSFFGLDSFIPFHMPSAIRMEKKGDVISFYSSSILLMKMENPAFLGSASFGFEMEGKGKVSLSIY